nr:integrase, catalytic region, zinc finger, CCHC-type, peptidase aspartic, catalytic [Tanacetum cinerariifolium]
MTKQERESMLYDEFDNFASEPGESIHSYYLRYAKLINDMNMIPMSMTPIKINTKFVNHLQHEWSRFVTSAKQEEIEFADEGVVEFYEDDDFGACDIPIRLLKQASFGC